jgi:RimJ/RimL family protein N-acetyltransferase
MSRKPAPTRASCRVAQKAGYLLEGTKREHWLFADGWHDVHLHARVSEALKAVGLAE